MDEDTNLSKIEQKANDILKDHNGVYLDKRLYSILKKDFPKLTRKEFNKVLDALINNGYSLERGLIRPLTDNKVKSQVKEHEEGKMVGKGPSERQRLSTLRDI
jgi:hypothetical protein